MSEVDRSGDAPVPTPVGGFEATRWSLIVAARDDDPGLVRNALSALCSTYWFPIYAYIRRRGYDADQATDLTQGFFAHLLEARTIQAADPARGRFRSFLLASCSNYLANERDRRHARKRGGGRRLQAFDALDAEARYRAEVGRDETPERIFLRRWAESLIAEALDRLKAVERDASRGDQFDRLRPALAPGPDGIPSSAELGDRLGLSPHAAETALYRLRRRFGRTLRETIAETLADPAHLEDEIRDLFAAFQR